MQTPTAAVASSPLVALRAASPVGLGIGCLLALAVAGPSLLNGFVLLDWTDTVERAAVGLGEALVLGLWATTPGRSVARPTGRAVPFLIATWSAAMLVSSGTAVHIAPAVVRTAEWALHVAFGVVVWNEARKGLRREDTTLLAVWAAGAVVGYLGVMLWAGIDLAQIPVAERSAWNSDVPALQGIRCIGTYALVPLALGSLAWLRPARRGAASSRWPGVVLAAAWMGLCWSGSRASIGAAALLVVAVALAAGPRRWAYVASTSVALGVGSLASMPLARGTVGGVGAFFSRSLPGGEANAFTSGRLSVWQTAADAWASRPWLGLGPDGAWPSMAPIGLAHPHNAVLQALVEWGLVGAVPFLALGAALLWTGLAPRRREAPGVAPGVARAVRVGAGAYLLAAFANAMLDGLTYDPASTLFMATAAALVCAATACSSEPEPAGRWAARGVVAVALTGAAVCVLHLSVLRALQAPGETPAPESTRVALVQAFPSAPILQGALGWAKDWRATDPEAALALARWGQARQSAPWAFTDLEAGLWQERGHPETARALHARAERARAHARRYATW